MSQPTLMIPPDQQFPRMFKGTVNSVGGALWFFNNASTLGRAETLDFEKLFPAKGATDIFNGILLLADVDDYVPPGRSNRPALRSGIHIPQSVRNGRSWEIGKAQGCFPYTNAEGEFSGGSMLFQLFDRKCTFTCVERRELEEADDADTVLEQTRTAALESSNVRIWALHGRTLYVVEVEFSTREYEKPVARPTPAEPPIAANDDGEDTRKPRRRRKERKEQED